MSEKQNQPMPESPEDKSQLAQDRTDWAEDRTLLANERTFAGWLRTGLAAAAVGLGLNAIFRQTEPTWLAKSGATVFFIIAILIFYLAWRSACQLEARLNSHAAEPMAKSHFGTYSLLLSAGVFSTCALLWLL